MPRRIYMILMALSIAGGVVLYFFAPDLPKKSLPIISLLPFFLFVASFHGIIAHKLKPGQKGSLILYPILMGLLYVLLIFIHIYILFPAICGW